MSSQDSNGESYVYHLVANPRIYGDTGPYGWTANEEEDADLREKQGHSSEEDKDPPLPQPGDMHIEFKRSSLPNTVKVPKVQFTPFRHVQEDSDKLRRKIWDLERENDKLKEEIHVLKWKAEDKSTSSSPSSPKKET